MRKKYLSSRVFALSFCLALSSAAMLSAEESAQDLLQLTTAELVSRAFAISKRLEPGLIAQLEDWSTLRSENGTLRSDLAMARNELSQLKLELERRASASTASAQELSEARAALKTISALVGSSSESWVSSIADVEKALKEAAMKQRRAEVTAWIGGTTTFAALVLAAVETILRAVGK
jgi:chromosome segregation ATPase